ncbi:MAG: acetolactate synthase large subunit [Actinomycetota bacterium]|nr:acetolactate synthase large subunit [Actinomycetota bacterium]
MRACELLVWCLENEGTRYVFGVPGEETEALLFALDASSIEFVPTRHEQGAAFIANVWGRLTGTVGVCLSTLGPGATNLMTGVADANLDKAPLVAITGQGDLERLHNESHQLLDVVAMLRPVTKWNTSISAPQIVPEVVRKAFKVAELEKPGATHLELPEDVAGMEVDDGLRPLSKRGVRRPAPDHQALNETMQLLREARRPLVIAGNGAIRGHASQHLTELAERLDIPVVATFMGKGAVSDRRRQSLFAMGMSFRDYVMEAVDAADVVLTVGYDSAEYAPEQWNPGKDKRVVHIDFSPAEVYANYLPVVEVVSDISAAVWELNRSLSADDVSFDHDWFPPVRERIVRDIASYELEAGQPFTVPGVLNVLRSVLDDDALLISDVGSHKMWIARNFPTYVPNGCVISNGLASMGIALPGGIAAALLDPARRVVAAMGDGGFLMNSQELETAKRLGVGFTVLVLNDFDYGLISWKQEMSHERSVSTRIDNPDLKQYAESFGIRGYCPKDLGELREGLREAVTSTELCVVEVRVDPSVNQELVERLTDHWAGRAGPEAGAGGSDGAGP